MLSRLGSKSLRSRGVKSGGRSECRGHSISGKEDGLDSLSFMAWAKTALMTFGEDMLIRRKERDEFPGLEENPQRGQAQSIEGAKHLSK